MLAGPCPLGLCDGSTWIDDPETRTVTPCRCRAQRIAQTRTTALSAVIPRRYRGVGFDRPPVTEIRPATIVRHVRFFVRDLDANLDTGRGLWFSGTVGTGKTTLAMLVSSAALDAGRTVAVYSLPRLLAEIRTTYDEGTDVSYTRFLDRLAEVDLLHIDDVGAEKTSPWVLEQLYALINARYEGEKSVIITTNLETEALVEQITARTVSRLVEMCQVMPLAGPDNRQLYAS